MSEDAWLLKDEDKKKVDELSEATLWEAYEKIKKEALKQDSRLSIKPTRYIFVGCFGSCSDKIKEGKEDV